MESRNERQLYPITEAAQILGGIGRTSIYELLKAGELQRAHIGRRSFITADSLQSYVERLKGAEHVAA